jgi:hypothetical protein
MHDLIQSEFFISSGAVTFSDLLTQAPLELLHQKRHKTDTVFQLFRPALLLMNVTFKGVYDPYPKNSKKITKL